MLLQEADCNACLRMPAMRCTIFCCNAKKSGKKRGPPKDRGPYRCEGQNLQRGTANAVELGGKATVCISYVRYGALMSKQQPFFVHVSHAWVA
jgi:hypothetical protein